jgi:hypothetical protein
MLRRAKEAGLPVDEEKLKQYVLLCDPDAMVSQNFDPKTDPQRIIKPDDWVHESVKARGLLGGRVHNDPPPTCVIVHG